MSGNISDNSRSGKYIVLAPIFGSLESGDREGKLISRRFFTFDDFVVVFYSRHKKCFENYLDETFTYYVRLIYQ